MAKKDVTPYPGPYYINPKIDEKQVLETKEKYCDNDIRIKAVPYSVEENESGGLTVSIAGS
ncbi:MAG: hypothetical protein HUJ78_02875 [Mogibacterium sp.]|nr:hypothetical protein [Mogibacterium sp.]